MTPELSASLIDHAKADADVFALISTRIFPGKTPQNVAAPYVVMTEVSTTPSESQDEMLGFDETLVQFACYAFDDRTALLVRKALRKAFCASGVTIDGVSSIGGATLRFLEADEVSLANAILELTFSHNPNL